MSSPRKLMVFVVERVSEWLDKGEVVDRYYNPGNLFDEVHLVLINNDRPNPAALQRLVGTAAPKVHNLSMPPFKRTLGWQPWLLRSWVRAAVDLAASIRPALIRCHGAHLNTYAASRIKAALGIPYVVSLHINPDEDVRKRARGWKNKLIARAQRGLERRGLRAADLVMPVYRPIVPYLQRLGVDRVDVCYNVLNPEHLQRKEDYHLHSPVRIVSVGRQFAEKNPDNLIRAVAQIPGVELTLVGDGALHDYLKGVARDCGMAERVKFFPAQANDELCRSLPEFDIFAVHTEYWEISKSVLEPLLTGLPVVINRRLGPPVPELSEDICLLVENTLEAYREAFERLIRDHGYRESLGRHAYAQAQALWVPSKTEAKFVEVYRRLMLEPI
jgi:glycosyltransferase involved in cell wall biosynthesis